MRMEDIRRLTRAQPFLPFRLHLSNGETFEIRHPDMVVVTLGAAYIASPIPGDQPDDPRDLRIISLVHILKVEYLAPPANLPSTATNGSPP